VAELRWALPAGKTHLALPKPVIGVIRLDEVRRCYSDISNMKRPTL